MSSRIYITIDSGLNIQKYNDDFGMLICLGQPGYINIGRNHRESYTGSDGGVVKGIQVSSEKNILNYFGVIGNTFKRIKLYCGSYFKKRGNGQNGLSHIYDIPVIGICFLQN
jgi:hypothetical protein